jgi:glycosyltransferase involved in cell wall biosynthesis
MLLSIITPSFNRGYCLDKLYHSLIMLKSNDFEWILVDDGSTDDTAILAQQWQEERKVNFRYIRQLNSGKTNAVISAFEHNPNGKYTLVLDSDDILVNNALDLIKQHLQNIKSCEIGLAFLKANTKSEIIGSKFNLPSSTYVEIYFGKSKCYGDKLFVVETTIYKNSLVPAFEGEKLIPEGVIYLNMQKSGKFRCINQVLYCGDYLSDGLSASSLKLAGNNINGFILEKLMLQSESLGFIDALKNHIKYLSYSLAGYKSIKSIFRHSEYKLQLSLFLLPTIILTWKRIHEIRLIIKKRI